MSDNTGVERPVHGHITQAPPDIYRLGPVARLEHRHAIYVVELIGDDEWSIRSLDGRLMGTLFMVSPVGEEHEPVYGVRHPGELATEHQGTDWRSLAAASINAVLDADEDENMSHTFHDDA